MATDAMETFRHLQDDKLWYMAQGCRVQLLAYRRNAKCLHQRDSSQLNDVLRLLQLILPADYSVAGMLERFGDWVLCGISLHICTCQQSLPISSLTLHLSNKHKE